MTDRTPARDAGADGDHDEWLAEEPSAIGRLFAPVAGYGVTLSSLFRPTVTEQ